MSPCIDFLELAFWDEISSHSCNIDYTKIVTQIMTSTVKLVKFQPKKA